MRVTTAFNKMLGFVGASVASVTFAPEGIVLGVRRRRAKHRCPCGWKTWSIYDRSLRRWRHLDLGATRCFLEAEICRIDCRRCHRVRTEEVPWARPGARHTKDFQDVVCWLAQRVDKTTITKLLRVSWEAVSKIVVDVVAEAIDDTRLDNLFRIGVDEVSYRKGHRYLTVVADHDRDGAVVWAGEGRDHKVLEAFYDELGEERIGRLEAISLDMGGAYKSATDNKAPHVTQCVDPFHLVKLANEAVDKARRWAWNEERRLRPPPPPPMGRPRKDAPARPRNEPRFVKHTRWALLKDPDALLDSQLAVLHELRRSRSVLYRCWQLKEGLRDLYRVRPNDAGEHLTWWLAWACRCRIPAFVTLAKTVRANRERILAAVELGLSNECASHCASL
jgi:transposase